MALNGLEFIIAGLCGLYLVRETVSLVYLCVWNKRIDTIDPAALAEEQWTD